uniref:Reverse transcriptase domain-containing protein n=1 Tax=Erythrocytic necrosis virus TaxID=1543320 RepID=A0A4D6QJF5_9VIRU|nr:hypothetical protein [Erythrocytic necrosis virus]
MFILIRQFFFLHGRYIGDNIRQLLDIIEHHETYKKPEMVFIVDFEKAFDKVDWILFIHAWIIFNFGNSFVKINV